MRIIFPSDILYIQEMKFNECDTQFFFFYAEKKIIQIFIEKFYGLMNIFPNNGMFNRHNAYTWVTKNPRLQRNTHNQIRFSINVWYGILNTTIIGPYFY